MKFNISCITPHILARIRKEYRRLIVLFSLVSIARFIKNAIKLSIVRIISPIPYHTIPPAINHQIIHQNQAVALITNSFRCLRISEYIIAISMSMKKNNRMKPMSV